MAAYSLFIVIVTNATSSAVRPYATQYPEAG